MGVFVGKVNTLAEKNINVSMTAALPCILETFLLLKVVALRRERL